jgi:hypothetical protein
MKVKVLTIDQPTVAGNVWSRSELELMLHNAKDKQKYITRFTSEVQSDYIDFSTIEGIISSLDIEGDELFAVFEPINFPTLLGKLIEANTDIRYGIRCNARVDINNNVSNADFKSIDYFWTDFDALKKKELEEDKHPRGYN